MNIAVTGNLGYIGNTLFPKLMEKGHKTLGIDIGYYSDDNLYKNNVNVTKQILKDIRDVELDDFYGIDVVVHLAALSNDPLGEFAPSITEEINLNGTLRVAECAKKAGVKRFIYSSSQSMYGVSDKDIELDEDYSDKNPITVYARTKWEAECQLRELNGNGFTTVFFRPSTVFGVSSNLRCDIVYNNFIACAYTSGKIEIKSDGTPFRPVVHVEDVVSAFIGGIDAPIGIVENRAFNVGIENGNYSVKDLANAAQRVVDKTEIVYTNLHNDSRTYKVSFERILTELREYYRPKWNLQTGGKQLIELFDKVNFTKEDFTGVKCNRLKKLNLLIENGIISSHDLRMKK